jgi:3-methyladenine DNA glycosylase AlkD
MTIQQAVEELQKLGTEQNRKVYRRHGVGDKLYGVSFANLKKLKKEIKTDHELARRLWASGNHDARILATMVADPAETTAALLDSWKDGLDNYIATDAFAKFVAATPLARQSAERWTESNKEWIGRAGWMLLTHLALHDASLPGGYFETYLEAIERRIHDSPNRVREAMNSALIAIALRSPKLEREGLAAARRIGPVEVDHGETSCETHDAEAYILKVRGRRERQRPSRAAAKRSNGSRKR